MEGDNWEHEGLNALDQLCLTQVANCAESLRDLLSLGGTCRRLRAAVAGADVAWQRRIYADFGLLVEGMSLKVQYDSLRRAARGEPHAVPRHEPAASTNRMLSFSGSGAGAGAGGVGVAGAGPSGSGSGSNSWGAGAGPSSAAAPLAVSASAGGSGQEASGPLRPFLPFVGVSTDGASDQPASDYWVGHMFTPSLRSFYSSEALTKNIHCLAVLQPEGYDDGGSDPHRTYLLDRLQLPAAYLRRDVMRSILSDQAWEDRAASPTCPDPLPPLPPRAVEAARRELSSCSTHALEDLYVHAHSELMQGSPWGLLLAHRLHPGFEAQLRQQYQLMQRLMGARVPHGARPGTAGGRAAAMCDGQRLAAMQNETEAQMNACVRRYVQYQRRLALQAAGGGGGGGAGVERPSEQECAFAKVLLKAQQILRGRNAVPYPIRQADPQRQPRLLYVEPPLRPLMSAASADAAAAVQAPAATAAAAAAPTRCAEAAAGSAAQGRQRCLRERPGAGGATVGLFDTVLLGRPPHVTCPMRCGALLAATTMPLAPAPGGDRAAACEAGAGGGSSAAALAAALNNGMASLACVQAFNNATDARAVLSASRSGALPPVASYCTNGWLEWIEFQRPGADAGATARGKPLSGHVPSLTLPEHDLAVRVLPVIWFRFYSGRERTAMRRRWMTRPNPAPSDVAFSHQRRPQQQAAAAAPAPAPAPAARAPVPPAEQQAVQNMAAAMAAAVAAAGGAGGSGVGGGGGGVAAQGTDGTLRILVGGQQVFEAPVGVAALAAAAGAAEVAAQAAEKAAREAAATAQAVAHDGAAAGAPAVASGRGMVTNGAAAAPLAAGGVAHGGGEGAPAEEGSSSENGPAGDMPDQNEDIAAGVVQVPDLVDSDDEGMEGFEGDDFDDDEFDMDDGAAPLPFDMLDAAGLGAFMHTGGLPRSQLIEAAVGAAETAAAAAAMAANAALVAAGDAGGGGAGTPPLVVQAVAVPPTPMFPGSLDLPERAPGVGLMYGWSSISLAEHVVQLRLRKPWAANLLLAKLIDCEDTKPDFNRRRGGCNIDAGNVAVQGPAPSGGMGEGAGPVVRLQAGVRLA